MAVSAPPDGDGFEQLEPAHQDVVTVLHYNFYGKRKVTGSADHRLKVYDRQPDGSWKLVDTWRGHDAEILDIKWSTPYMGAFIGSIGEDQKFKVWQEDVYELPNSGRRFKCISTLQSSSRIPFVSFDFKSVHSSDVHVALLSRDALLTVYEANEPGSMASWALVDQFHVCPPPSRGEETTFKVAFDPNPLPCWAACRAGVPQDALSLVTAGMNTAKVWRTGAHQSDDGRRHFYLAADLSSYHHRGLVRDVAWAPMNVRGWDMIATTCTDGYIRVFEIHTPVSGGGGGGDGQGTTTSFTSTDGMTQPMENPQPPYLASKRRGGGARRTASTSSAASQHQQRGVSGIGAELAGAAGSVSTSTLPMTASLTRRPSRQREDNRWDHDQGVAGEGQVGHTIEQVAAIRDRYGGVWQVSWRSTVFESMELMTSHEDGSLRIWKQLPPSQNPRRRTPSQPHPDHANHDANSAGSASGSGGSNIAAGVRAEGGRHDRVGVADAIKENDGQGEGREERWIEFSVIETDAPVSTE